MRIYYFGELIEENGVKVQKQKVEEQKQVAMQFEEDEQTGSYMQSIGDILKEIDMNLDVYRPAHMRKRQIA